MTATAEMAEQNRLDRRFVRGRTQGKTLLMVYLMAGDPDADITIERMHAAVAAGAEVIELGLPFSDPIADGPTIQAAHERALAGGMSLRAALELLARFRAGDTETPVVLMGYLNPIERFGAEAFAAAASGAGADAVLVVDQPAEEAADLHAVLERHGLHLVPLLAPTSTAERVALLREYVGGFAYYVSLRGVTGAGGINLEEVQERVQWLRGQLPLPVAVGFGIREPAQAAALRGVADAVVVGSGWVATAHEQGTQAAADWLSTLAAALAVPQTEDVA